jgi:hypothetical protein
MKKRLFTLLCAAFTTVICAQEPAVVVSDKTGWHKIGETTVDFQKEEDEVAVLLADKFAALKFKVTGASIQIEDLDVIFEEGDKQNIRIGYAIKAEGSESRPIDLKGGAERSIKRIVFRYKTVDKNETKKAHVEIWGKKTNPDKAHKKDGDDKMKHESKEAKKDIKEAKKDTEKEVKKESKEAKKEAKETKKEAEKEMKKD